MLEQPDLAQLTLKLRRKIVCAIGDKVWWNILWVQIAPTLKWSARTRMNPHDGWLENDIASPDAIGTDARAKIQDSLPAVKLAADDPIEGATIENFVAALRCHPGCVNLLAIQPNTFGNPAFQIFDRLGSNAEFDQVKRHRQAVTVGSARAPASHSRQAVVAITASI